MDKSRNLPQLFALKGYLYTQLYCKEDGERKLLGDAEEFFLTALDKCGSEDDGYKKTIYASLIHLFHLNDEKDDKIINYAAKFNQQESKLGSDAEVLAMQGHAAAYLHKYPEAITFYEKAMEKKVTAEWVFGLAFALIHRNVGKSTYTDTEKIEYLLRHAFSLDPTYDLAKLKLAKHLWDSRVVERFGKNVCHAKEEIDDIIDQVKQNQSKNITILEETAKTISRIDPEKALELFKQCYTMNPKSQRTLRGLGDLHSKLWEKKKNSVHLEEAIRYFTENIKNCENAKPFDLSRISKVHADAYDFYTKEKTGKVKGRNGKRKGKNDGGDEKAEEHASKCKEWIEKLIDQLTKGFLDDRDKPEVCYRISQYYKTFPDREKEIKYLNKTLSCAMEGREDGLKFVDQAQNRLLEIATKLDDKTECYRKKSDVFKQRGHFDSAIFYLEKALLEVRSQENQRMDQVFEMRVEEIQLYINLIRKKRKYSLNDSEVTMGIVRGKIYSLNVDPNKMGKKAELEFDFQKLSIEKLFDDNDKEHVGELWESRLAFEEKLKDGVQDEQSLENSIFNVCHDSKVVLERCMQYIRDNVFPDGKKFIYYPKHCDSDQERLDLYVKEKGWHNGEKDFSSILPSLATFLVDRLDSTRYPQLLQFIEVRNKGEHDLKAKQIKVLWKHCSDKESRIRLARDASCYAVEVWNKVKYEIDEYLINNINNTVR